MNNKKFSLDDFDYAAFRSEAIDQLKMGGLPFQQGAYVYEIRLKLQEHCCPRR